MTKNRPNLFCRNCGENNVSKVKFPYPSRVRINSDNNKVKLITGPLQLFTFMLWIILFLIFSLNYFLGLGNPGSAVLSAVVVLITASLLGYILFIYSKSVSADVYQCMSCGTVWLLKDNSGWENAVKPAGKFLRNFKGRKIYAEDKNEKTWICSGCGEKVPENYELCWKCGASRKVHD